ncbi:hypothetical protein OH687_35280 [Burkholderia anthina]|nr:hypothetical protein OH687_35280 [Burkholderia anthina]
MSAVTTIVDTLDRNPGEPKRGLHDRASEPRRAARLTSLDEQDY